MFGERNLYSIQGMALDAPIDVVKAACPARAKEHYPDGRGIGSEEGRIKTTESRKAYSVIYANEQRIESADDGVPIDAVAPSHQGSNKSCRGIRGVLVGALFVLFISVALNCSVTEALSQTEDVGNTNIIEELLPEPVEGVFVIGDDGSLVQSLVNRGVTQENSNLIIEAIDKVFPSSLIRKGSKVSAILDQQMDFNGQKLIFPMNLDINISSRRNLNVSFDESEGFIARINVVGGLKNESDSSSKIVAEKEVILPRTMPDCPTDQTKRRHLCSGSREYLNGDYDGEWRDGVRAGQGVWKFASGDEYSGHFLQGYLNGQFKVSYTNGDEYIGSYIRSKRSGLGVYFWSDGVSYSGEWQDGVPSQRGKLIGPQNEPLKLNKISDNGTYMWSGEMTLPDVLSRSIEEAETSAITSALHPNTICRGALIATLDRWDIKSPGYADEALRRGLTIEECKSRLEGGNKAEPPSSVASAIAVDNGKKTNAAHETASQTQTTQPQGRMVALVIGNSNYQKISWLENADDDARAVAGALGQLGFSVTLITNATHPEMRRQLLGLSEALDGDVDTVLLYYSGHAVQVGPNNMLLPVDVKPEIDGNVPLKAIDLSEFIQVMETKRISTKIIVIDACRENPFNANAQGGLASINAGSGTFIAYSTAPGQVAVDGLEKKSMSPYTEALVAALKNPNGGIEDTFKQVRSQVVRATDGGQIPWDSSSLTGNFSFELQGSPAKNYSGDEETAAKLPSQQEVAGEGDEETVNLKAKKKVPLETGYSEGDDAELAGMSADVSAPPAKPKTKPEDVDADSSGDDGELVADATDVGEGYPAPKPRPKPIEVLMMAAINMQLEPASAPPSDPTKRVTPGITNLCRQALSWAYDSWDNRPESQIAVGRVRSLGLSPEDCREELIAQSGGPRFQRSDPTKRVSPGAGNSQGYVIAPESMIEGASLESNAAAKTSLTEEIENGNAEDAPTIRTITASASGDDLFWWPTQLVFDTNKAVRRDGAPQQFTSNGTTVAGMMPLDLINLCRQALSWTYDSWDNRTKSQIAVQRASSLGWSPTRCREMLVGEISGSDIHPAIGGISSTFEPDILVVLEGKGDLTTRKSKMSIGQD